MSKLITVYGSLKKDRYNHSILSSSKFIGNASVIGTLYSLGSYPALIEEGYNQYEAETYEVDDKTYQSISNMERGAGYKEVAVSFPYEIDDGVGVSEVKKTSIVFYATDTLAQRCKESYKQIDSY